VLSIGFGVALVVLAWWLGQPERNSNALKTVPTTKPGYWVTMLTAGVLGTVLGDYFEHAVGDDAALIGLTIALAAALLAYRKEGGLGVLTAYWFTVAVARTAGTAIGDWLAENTHAALGLPLSTAISGGALVLVLLFWPGKRTAAALA
jgi:uncharacterized membrane-anchored protein